MRLPHRTVAVLLLALAALDRFTFADSPPDAVACGGPWYADLGALEPAHEIARRLSIVGDENWDTKDRPELRFLAPFEREHPRELAWLWGASYGDEPRPGSAKAAATPAAAPAMLEPAALGAALATGDAQAKREVAERYVAAWVALPPVQASEVKASLVQAAGVIDPVAAAELWAVEQALVAGIPNGWSGDVQRSFKPADAQALERRIDAWVSKHRAHPLAGYAELWKVRTRYFSGQSEAAWEVILKAPPSLRVRALAEARYLLLQGLRPSAAQEAALSDVAWVAALTQPERIDEASFAKWWALSEAERGRKASVNLQERLLHWAATRPQGTKLPPSFPRDARAPSPFWVEMRAAALLRSGDTAGALAQLAMLPSTEPGRANLEANAELAAGHPERAAQVAGLDADAREYIVAVFVATPELERSARGTGPLGAVARRELGLRVGAAGDFRKAAAIIEKDDASRAASWRTIADLTAKKGPKARLELARHLAGHAGELFAQPATHVYRAISVRHGSTAWPTESRELELAMARRTERYQALVAYVAWLEQHPKDPEAQAALSEADATYNRLVNYAGSDTLFWGTTLPSSDLAKRLRAVGKIVRGKP